MSRSSMVPPCRPPIRNSPLGATLLRHDAGGPAPPLSDPTGAPLGGSAGRAATAAPPRSTRAQFSVPGPALVKTEPRPLLRLQVKRPLGRGPTRAPSAPQVLRGHNQATGSSRSHRRTRAAPSAIAAAWLPTRGRGFKREEGPQASSRAGRLSTVRRSSRIRSGGPAAPPAGLLHGARTPRVDGPDRRVYPEFSGRPLRSWFFRCPPCSGPWPRPSQSLS
ncbi:hypothetical protein NDU88_002159 [Pleurodeles waltl]|uniref:Uncharacterized protein n=1 Tax=Pleurodeles waltl TaxID=8319 RepID=A0AAV7UAK1_PLEWA|nr:hypothetical protein NDU88_002159 [Pleurodeles waltl]